MREKVLWGCFGVAVALLVVAAGEFVGVVFRRGAETLVGDVGVEVASTAERVGLVGTKHEDRVDGTASYGGSSEAGWVSGSSIIELGRKRRLLGGKAGMGADEIPFDSGSEDVRVGGSDSSSGARGVEASRLCDKLRDAIVSGNGVMLMDCRREALAAGERCVEGLTDLVNCGVPKVEVEALRLLTQIGSEKGLAVAVGKMLTVDLGSPHIAEYLGVFSSCRDGATADWLVDFLGRTELANVRERVLVLLSVLRGESAVRSLADYFEKASDDLHAEDCLLSLAERNDSSHVEMLGDLLLNSVNSDVRDAATVGLAGVGNAEACGILISEASDGGANAGRCVETISWISSSYGQETLLNAVSDGSLPGEVRRAAATALSGQNSTRVYVALRNVRDGERDGDVRAELDRVVDAMERARRDISFSGGTVSERHELWF